MRNLKFVTLLCLFVAFSFISCVEKQKDNAPKELILFDFEEGFNDTQVTPQDATFEIAKNGKNTYLKVKNGFTLREAGVKLKSSADKPWDLNGYHQIKADVSNIGDEFIQVELFVGNDPNGLVRWYCSDYADLNPGESKTITIDLAWTPWVFNPQLSVEGMRGIPGKLKTDIAAIQEMVFCSRYATQENEFTVDNIRAVGHLVERDTTNFFPFVDQFGQYIHTDWKNKIHSEEELKTNAAKDQKTLEETLGPENRSKFGGWTAGPKLEATGFFRTEKHNGKWWMVDPKGYLFWSAGVNCMAANSVSTGITAREKYFKWLPEDKGEYKDFYSTSNWASHGFYKGKTPYATYNFYESNLYKVYGKNWIDDFRNQIHLRLKKWGLNTIGFMSDFGATSQQKTPYVGSIWIRNTPEIEGSEGFWGKFHDVFDPAFKIAVHKSVIAQKNGAGDPWCFGYFVDNEMSWGTSGSLSLGTLKSPATQPAKIEFVKDLTAKYKTIDQLNVVWGTSYSSWDALLNTTETPNEELAKDDLLAFYEKIAVTYFKTVNDELKAIAPNQLYLGCRFAWANNDIVLTAASKYLDIMSFNKYEYSVEDIGLPAGIDKPILIGEFHFGALDRGSFHVGVKKADSQEERGQFYQNYMQGAYRNPYIIGAHWFQYIDEPNTGRGDGENYNVGLINVTNTPYNELIDKIKETNYMLYEYRSNN